MIKILINQQSQVGSGLKFFFLPFDPDELVDQIKLTFVIEKVEGNDNPMLGEQIAAIADKLIEYESITINQNQNTVSVFNSSICLKRTRLWNKDFMLSIRLIAPLVLTSVSIF